MGKRRSRLFQVVTALLVIFIILLGVAIYKTDQWHRALVADLCGVAVHRIFPTPDAKAVLITFDVSCGATTPFSTQVSLLPSGVEFSREKYPAFFVVEGQHDLAVHWRNDGEIEIVIPRNKQVYRQEPSANGIAVTYK